MSIGQRIKSMRKQQGLSIDDLAYKLGKNRTTVYRYENGDIENLPLGILDSLANALNTTPAHLMGWEIDHEVTNYIQASDVKRIAEWRSEFDIDRFSPDEHEKLMEYAKFLISLRND